MSQNLLSHPPFPRLSSFSKGKPAKQKLTGAQKRRQNLLERQQLGREIAEIKQRIAIERPPRGYNPWAAEDASTQAAEPERVVLDSEPDAAAAAAAAAAKKKVTVPKPPPGSAGLTSALLSNLKSFEELPISSRSKRGLADSRFKYLTRVQRGTMPHALAGRDVLASARTGSGKTLAYLIPVLERLFLEQWTLLHGGLGALILAPTRELAVQIFDVLRTVGKHHDFSAGLVIGGKDAESEKKIIASINILVATPGRLLQHMDETYHFDASGLRILVLDEADRILDMGFSQAVDGIIANLPSYPQRQTLLFSATQTSEEMRNLAKLSLHEPEVIGVHDADETVTPRHLTQHYMLLNAGDKINTLWTFIKLHLWQKTIVFLSTSKQVRFIFEAFCRIRPGVPLLHMHGNMKQATRMSVFYEFCNQSRAVLFATDVAARGLDFPDVNWVLQADCPLTTEDYIHRVGRTARFTRRGHALTFLQEHELPLVQKLKDMRIEVKEVRPDTHKEYTVTPIIGGFIAEDTELKYLAQKAFVSYIRHVHLAPDKSIFSVRDVDGPALAASMGLPGIPTIKGLKGSKNEVKNLPHAVRKMLEDQEKARKAAKSAEKKKKADLAAGAVRKSNEAERMLRRTNKTVFDESRLKMRAGDEIEDDEEAEDFMKLTKRGQNYSDVEDRAEAAAKTAERRKLDTIKAMLVTEEADDDGGKGGLSDDDDLIRLAEASAGESSSSEGEDDGDAAARAHDAAKQARKAAKRAAKRKAVEERLRQAMLTQDLQVATLEEAIRQGLDPEFVAELRAMVKEHDPQDKARQRERVRERNRKRKAAEKAARMAGRGGGGVAVLGGGGSDDDDVDYAQGYEASDSGDDDDDDDDSESSDGGAGPMAKRGRGARGSHSDDDESVDGVVGGV